MGRNADLLGELRLLAIRAEEASKTNARLKDENGRLRKLAVAQLEQMREITRDFSASARIHYPGSGSPVSTTLASR